MHEVDLTTEQMLRSVLAYAENRLRLNPVPLDRGSLPAADHLELIREPDLGVVLFRRLGWLGPDYDSWAQALHDEEVAFIPPSKWEGETVGRFAFLHPDTRLDLVRHVLDRTK